MPALTRAATAKSSTRLKLEAAFAAADDDHSGEVDVKELRGLLKRLGVERSEKECDELVKRVDTDKVRGRRGSSGRGGGGDGRLRSAIRATATFPPSHLSLATSPPLATSRYLSVRAAVGRRGGAALRDRQAQGHVRRARR